MSCTGTQDIGAFASGVWLNLGSPTDISALSISGWVTQQNTIGSLNAYTAKCHTIVSGMYVCPDIDLGEYSILGAIYATQFWNYRAQAVAGAGGITPQWVSLRDGDSEIRRVNAGELMKSYVSLGQDAQQVLSLVAFYNDFTQNGTLPLSVDMWTILPPFGIGPAANAGIGGFNGRGYYRS